MIPTELGIELRREYWRVVRMKVIGTLCLIFGTVGFLMLLIMLAVG